MQRLLSKPFVTITTPLLKTEKLTKDRARGVEYLAGVYETEKDAIEGMLPSIEDDIWLKELMIQANLAVALTSAYSAKAMVAGIMFANENFKEQGEQIIEQIDKMITKITDLQTAMGEGGIDPADIKDIPRPKPPGGGGAERPKNRQWSGKWN